VIEHDVEDYLDAIPMQFLHKAFQLIRDHCAVVHTAS